MQRTNATRAVVTAAMTIAGATVSCGSAATAQVATRDMPEFAVDRAWPKLPQQWNLGHASSIGIDAQDNVWVLHRPRTLKADQAGAAAPPVLVFDAAGNFLKAWGGAASGYEWPEREHGIHVDHKGFVWVGGNNCPARALTGLKPVGDDQLVKFAPDGKFVLQIGRSNTSGGNADTRNLHQPADVWVHPPTNELCVADGYGNHRIAVFDADTGAFKRMWGAFGNPPRDEDKCPPPSLKSVPPGAGPDQFSIVHAVRVSRDGIVYAADRENRRVQSFTLDGKFLKQVMRHEAPFARNLALSPEPDQQFLYVGGGTDIVVVDRKSLEIVGSIAGPEFVGGGHQIATDSKGNIYVAAIARGLQKLVFKGVASPAVR